MIKADCNKSNAICISQNNFLIRLRILFVINNVLKNYFMKCKSHYFYICYKKLKFQHITHGLKRMSGRRNWNNCRRDGNGKKAEEFEPNNFSKRRKIWRRTWLYVETRRRKVSRARCWSTNGIYYIINTISLQLVFRSKR